MSSTKLYRATNGYTGARSCWSPERDTAEAYRSNQGFGGADIVTCEADGTVLDVRSGTGVDYVALAEALGYEDAQETAREWLDNGWRYPWEESRKVSARLDASGYAWLVYNDDYPELATTWCKL